MNNFIPAPAPDFFSTLLTIVKPNTKALRYPYEIWCDSSDECIFLSQSAWSILAIILLRKKITQKNRVKVLVPSYFCVETLGIFDSYDVDIVFYKTAENFHSDLKDLEKRLALKDVDVVIGVNYFGIHTDVNKISKLSKIYDAWFIEDSTHCLESTGDIGHTGDFVIFSPHKLFAVPYFAVLVIKKNKIIIEGKYIYEIKKIMMDIIENNFKKSVSNFYFMTWFLKRTFQKMGFRRKHQYERLDNNYLHHEIIYKPSNPIPPSLSLKLISKLNNTSVAQIKSKRLIVREIWDIAMNLFGLESMLNSEQKKYSLYYSPYKEIKSNSFLASIEAMKSKNVPFHIWPNLPKEVCFDRTYVQAINQRNSIALLPTHQSTSLSSIASVVLDLLSIKNKELNISALDLKSWIKLEKIVSPMNLMQSHVYSEIRSAQSGWTTVRWLISDVNNLPICIIQGYRKQIPILKLNLFRVNRAPLLLYSSSNNNLDTINKIFCIQKLLFELKKNTCSFILQIAPEIENSDVNLHFLNLLGFLKSANHNWGSGTIALFNPIEDLRKKINKRWKHAIANAKKAGVFIRKVDNNKNSINHFLEIYSQLERNNKFKGIDHNLIRLLSDIKNMPNYSFNLYEANIYSEESNFEILGYQAIIFSGDTATNLLIASTQLGDKLDSNSALYWYSICDAKDSGLKFFDMGGMGMQTPKGIYAFKYGLRPDLYELIGEWRYYFGFFPTLFGLFDRIKLLMVLMLNRLQTYS